MGRIAYFLLVLPLSYLPLFVLYRFADPFYLVLITVFPYRKSVIDDNLKRCFPEKTVKERKKIKRRFYRHFADILIEGVKNLSISDRELKRRISVTNSEIMQKLFDENRNVLLISGHYNNWEWLVTGQGLLYPHTPVGIGKKMTSGFWDKQVNRRRSRYGMHVVHAGNFRDKLSELKHEVKAVLVLGDQSPADPLKSYWTTFFNQETAVLFGAELMAHELDYTPVFYVMNKIKRGYYTITLEVISNEPTACEYGFITEKQTALMEAAIRNRPEHWLWSHKRWKRTIPENLDELKRKQRDKFNTKFSS